MDKLTFIAPGGRREKKYFEAQIFLVTYSESVLPTVRILWRVYRLYGET